MNLSNKDLFFMSEEYAAIGIRSSETGTLTELQWFLTRVLDVSSPGETVRKNGAPRYLRADRRRPSSEANTRSVTEVHPLV